MKIDEQVYYSVPSPQRTFVVVSYIGDNDQPAARVFNDDEDAAFDFIDDLTEAGKPSHVTHIDIS
jgi:hypothetical protein